MPKFTVCVTQKVERIGAFEIEAESQEAAIEKLHDYRSEDYEAAVLAANKEHENAWDEGDWCNEAGAYALLDENGECLADLELYE